MDSTCHGQRKKQLGLRIIPSGVAGGRPESGVGQHDHDFRRPQSDRRKAGGKACPATSAHPTFSKASQIVIDMRRPTWTNTKHAKQWTSTLATYAYPKIGSKLVTDIASADILAVLAPIWTEKPETASRVRQRVETVLDWAVAQGYRNDNPANR